MTVLNSTNQLQPAGLPRLGWTSRRAFHWPAIWAGLLIALFAPPLVSRALSATPEECEVSGGYKPVSKCIVDTVTNDVVIGAGAKVADCQTTVAIDKANLRLGRITINPGGVLKLFDRTAQLPMNLATTGIQVFGSLEIGDAKCPIGTINQDAKVTITFTGSKTACDGKPCKGTGYDKGIQVEAGGTLRMYGAKGVPPAGVNWTYLTEPAGPAKYNSKDPTYIGDVSTPVTTPADELHLLKDVSSGPRAWRADDWIAVATTSFSPWETEFVQVLSVTPEGTGSKVKLKTKLGFYHFGGLDPGDPATKANYEADHKLNYGIDERAEVGLISRNVMLTSDTDNTLANKKDESTHWGGEIRILPKFEAVSIQGVELQKFGKEQLASYPIHFHMAGDLSGKKDADKLVDSNSIDHSYNKCATIHSTESVSLTNNVCARITGHIFYEEIGDEYNIAFTGNLGMGAMSNSFDINAATAAGRIQLIKDFYWIGDRMVDSTVSTPPPPGQQNIGFNQFDIFDPDSQSNPVHGICGEVNPFGRIDLKPKIKLPGCARPNVYLEPPSGFWITNPSAKLTGNSIAGCQDVGKAYWYVPPKSAAANAVKFIPIGKQYSSYGPKMYGLFDNNRGHGCYSGIYGEDDGLVSSDQLKGYQNGMHDTAHQAVVDEFDRVTLSRIRDRGVWLRPTFFVVDNARVATVRDDVSLVTSGGVDGNYPGVWGLLSHSVIAGISANNVDRWGPCGKKVIGVAPVGQVRGGEWGCIDQTNPDNVGDCATKGTCNPTMGGEFLDRGYASPDWPMFGFLIYDGPPLIVTDRFVNFRVAPGSQDPPPKQDTLPPPQYQAKAANLLTEPDDKILKTWGFYGIPGCKGPGMPMNPPAYTRYEGDAALGWFNANQSAYPAATTTKDLTFTNVDLRHQIYTETVNRGQFTDGDENTTILDLDGTLSGVRAKAPSGAELPTISLNNLGINNSSNSADECLSEGAEDYLLEGRPTSTMVPSAVGQLEFEMLYPPRPCLGTDCEDPRGDGHTELLTFQKDTIDFAKLPPAVPRHGSMPLKSRNGLGDWEPKVTHGYGYTVTAGPYLNPAGCVELPRSPVKPGIGSKVDLTLTDIVNAPKIDAAHPFYVQVGICYKNKSMAAAPADMFKVTRGYRSYGGGDVVNPPNSELKKYWGGFLKCNGLDSQLAQAADPKQPNIMPNTCPAVSITGSPVVTLNKVETMPEMTTDGKLNGPPVEVQGGKVVKSTLNNYYYDKDNGWLFVWVAQTEANAHGPSPLGDCTGASTDPFYCPSKTTPGDTYYVCPAQGCPTYRIELNDPNYKPGESNCGDPYSMTQGYEWPGPPVGENVVVLKGTSTSVVRVAQGGLDNKFPHYAAASAPSCPLTTPPSPSPTPSP